MRITFLPPPLEGTISAGVYDKTGKLVRTLHRAAAEKDFTVGLNGFITHWDGNNDAGRPLPSGKYSVRGYAVGPVAVEGIAYRGNDWIIDEDAPRIAQLGEMRVLGRELLVGAKLVDGKPGVVHVDLAGGQLRFEPVAMTPSGPDLATMSSPPAAEVARVMLDGTAPTPSVPGRDGSAWLVQTVTEGEKISHVVQQQAAGTKEVLRVLEIAPGEPQPVTLAVAPDRDEIFLGERDARQWRVRGLRLKERAESGGGKAVSTWEVFFSKSRWYCDDFPSIASQLGRAQPFAAEEKISLRLVPNPLFKDAVTAVDVQIGFDREGAFLRTADGLPLVDLTETPNLKWAVMGREGGRVITVFQSDGAVVEEFKVRKLANMMAFNAGEYEWTAK
ncbi:MAG: hypothetical protein M3463_00505 [Verrucomicrobiota bacterium]|nr:hypothetical protein [Verrucomicrobiota bacterium]